MALTHYWWRQRCLLLSFFCWLILSLMMMENDVMISIKTTLFVSAAHSRRRIVVRRESEPKYDRSITTFSPDGRLEQVEYAMEAALRGSTIAACHLPNNEDGICLVVDSSSSSSSTTKVHRIDHHIFLITAGLSGDARALAYHLRTLCQNHRLTFGEPPTTKQVAKMAGQIQHQITRTAGARPFGCTALVVGIDDKSASGGSCKIDEKEDSTPSLGTPRLFETDPGGIVEECEFYAVAGKGRSSLGRIVAPFVTKIFSSSKPPPEKQQKDDSTPSSGDVISELAEIALKHIYELSGSRKGDASANTVDIWTIKPHATQRGGMKATCYRNISKHSLSQMKVLMLSEAEAEKNK